MPAKSQEATAPVGLTKALFLAILISAAVLIALWLPVVLHGQSAVVGGQRYFWLYDDEMISMRYARNLAHGNGLVWNPGERVEGYTNPLWTVIMAVFHLLPIPSRLMALPILLLNIALAVACLPALALTARRLGGGLLSVCFCLLAFVVNIDMLHWTTQGWEVTLLTLLLLCALTRILGETMRPRPATYVLLGVLALVRSDAVLLSLLLCGYALSVSSDQKRILRYFPLTFAFPIGYECWRIYYYHALLPNTAYLKTTGWPGRVAAGEHYLHGFLHDYWALVTLAVLNTLVTTVKTGEFRRVGLLGICIVSATFVTGAGGDAFPGYRFFAPTIPLWLLLAFLPWLDGNRAISRQRRATPVVAALMACVLAVSPTYLRPYHDWLVPPAEDVGNIALGVWLKEHTPKSATVADFYAGSPFYFSERRGVDLLGKMDPVIAHEPVTSDGTKPGHNKFDFAYSLGVRRPDYVVADFSNPPGHEKPTGVFRQMAEGDWAFIGALYFDPTFRRHYQPQRLAAPVWRDIYQGNWGTIALSKSQGIPIVPCLNSSSSTATACFTVASSRCGICPPATAFPPMPCTRLF